MRKEERLAPVYTLCLYHGAEEWDGPRSLKDMMDFGEEGPGHGEREVWEKCFADYPMSLVCVNELPDCSGFQTSLRELFTILPYRGDKRRLKELLDRNSVYQKMDGETAQTIGVLMGIKKLMENREKYKTEEGEYNVCHAINEMMEDSRLEGIAEGEARGIVEGRSPWKSGRKRQPDNRNHRKHHERAALFPGKGLQSSRKDPGRVSPGEAHMPKGIKNNCGIDNKRARTIPIPINTALLAEKQRFNSKDSRENHNGDTRGI